MGDNDEDKLLVMQVRREAMAPVSLLLCELLVVARLSAAHD
jgi:hypothetical protein